MTHSRALSAASEIAVEIAVATGKELGGEDAAYLSVNMIHDRAPAKYLSKR